ncbi:MAG: LacI family transcriptional regulator [Clostridiales bacterium]|nr:LacI family transcriptional regulator [Clostridiales bacterium]
MRKSVTLVDIAKRCNTSNVTVSKALADKSGVSPELREKIKQVAEEMGYVSVKTANTRKKKNIGVLIPDKFISASGSFYWVLYNNLVQMLMKKNHYCIMEILSEEDERALVMPNMVMDKKISGLISLGQLSLKYAKKLRDQIPEMIALDYYISDFEVDTVITNGYSGAYKITNYLISMGHTKIGYVGSKFATSSILDRYMGYSKSMLEKGFEIRSEWTIDDRDSEGDFIEMKFPDILPTAFVCNCDEAAYIVIKQLKAMGYSVPNDISIVGYDNYMISEMSDPKITTIAIDATVMAAQAVKAVIERIENPLLPFKVRNLEGDLNIKNSVRKLK